MTRLKLTLHPTKTRIMDMGREGFDFPFPQAEVQEGRQTLTLHMAESKGYEVSAEQNPSNHDPKKVE